VCRWATTWCSQRSLAAKRSSLQPALPRSSHMHMDMYMGCTTYMDMFAIYGTVKRGGDALCACAHDMSMSMYMCMYMDMHMHMIMQMHMHMSDVHAMSMDNG